MSPARKRVLQMIEQHGGQLHRHEIGFAFATGRMTTQRAAQLAGFLCKPLREAGWIEERRNRSGFHVAFVLTPAGRRALRETA